MNSVLGMALMFVALVSILLLALGMTPGRIGRPPRGLATRRSDPSGGRFALLLLAPPAAMTLVGLRADTSAAFVGGCLGGVIVLSAAFHFSREVVPEVLGAVALVASLVGAYRFVTSHVDGDLGLVFRLSLVLLVIVCFWLGVIVGGHWSAIRGKRGLAMFAVVDVAVFFASPAGTQLTDLAASRFYVYLAVVSLVAAGLGWVVSEAALGLSAVGVTVTTLLLAQYDPDPLGPLRVTATMSAVVVGAILYALTARLHR